MMPSIRISEVPPKLTMMTTRTSGIGEPPESRKSVCSGERLLSVNSSWKPLPLSLFVVTVTEVSASSTSCETGTGTTGPIMSVRLKPLTIVSSGNIFWQRDPETAADRFQYLVRPTRAVSVADAPELLRIAKILRRDVVEPFALRHGVLLQKRE